LTVAPSTEAAKCVEERPEQHPLQEIDAVRARIAALVIVHVNSVARSAGNQAIGCAPQTSASGKLERAEDQLKDICSRFTSCRYLSKRGQRKTSARSVSVRRRSGAGRRRRHARKANAKLIEQLETDAGAWHQARYLSVRRDRCSA
jgi:hypothetical protein